MKKENTFKNYVNSKKTNYHPFIKGDNSIAGDEKYPNLETSFGTHSLPVDNQKYPDLETSFGKHGKTNLSEKVSTTPGKILADEQIADHGVTDESIKNIHGKNALDKTDSLHRYSLISRDINSALHEKKSSDDIKKHIKSIDKSLDAASMDHATHVFTGLRESPAKHFKGTGTAKVHLPAYTSTSTRFGTAEDFANRVEQTKGEKSKHTPLNSDAPVPGSTAALKKHAAHVLKIHLPKGTKAGSIMHFAKHKDEHEILLHRGHNIEIHPHPTIDSHGTHVWHARVISHTPDKIDE